VDKKRRYRERGDDHDELGLLLLARERPEKGLGVVKPMVLVGRLITSSAPTTAKAPNPTVSITPCTFSTTASSFHKLGV
jgi:hypothetical protein